MVDEAEEITAQIQFVPRIGLMQEGFHATIQQYHDRWGTYNTIPRLSINNIIPFGSRVFTLVEEGRMAEFQEMLRLGQASLRDYDEFGASLLFVS